MKSKLRKISVDGNILKHALSEKHIAYGALGEGGYIITRLRIFKEGFKNTPMEIRFHHLDGYAVGNPITHEFEGFNLNKPSTVEQLIRLGMKDSKWNWEEKPELLDDIELLKKMGVDTSFLESERIPPIKL